MRAKKGARLVAPGRALARVGVHHAQAGDRGAVRVRVGREEGFRLRGARGLLAQLVAPRRQHHLVAALFPAAALGTALIQRRLGLGGWFVAVPAYFFVAWPLYWLRPLQKMAPGFKWQLQESKFFGLVVLGILCAVVAWRSPREDQ